MQISNDYYLIVDLEATCSRDATIPRNEMEIIEIGAVMLSSHTFEIVSEFQTFVRPVRHPKLTAFCTELTSITQADVDKACSFSEALQSMKTWMTGFDDALFCSWGDYDRKQFQQDCQFHGVDSPFLSDHLNLKPGIAKALRLKKPMGVDAAIRHLGLKFAGTHHRGLDDARNIARIVQRVCLGTRPEPEAEPGHSE